MKRQVDKNPSSLLEEETVLRRALGKLASLGFVGSPGLGKQLEENYKGADLSHLAAEYWRTKSPALGYLFVAACIVHKDFLDAAARILCTLERGESSSKYEEREGVRASLRSELEALRAE